MKLFKYLKPERIDILKNKSIRFSQPSVFNDPFEFKPVISTVASPEYVEKYFNDNLDVLVETELSNLTEHFRYKVSKSDLRDMWNDFFASHKHFLSQKLENTATKFSDVFTEKSNELIGVLSLTEKCDNLLMWAHYADSHRGICLGFDATADFFNRKRSENDEFYHLRKVEYSGKRPSKSMTDMCSTDMFLLKSNDWKYEQEWRICSVLIDANTINEQVSPTAYLFNLPGSAITEVIVGANADEALITSINEILNNDSELSHVKLKRAKVSKCEFSLEFDDL